jgi:hypothetical protein
MLLRQGGGWNSSAVQAPKSCVVDVVQLRECACPYASRERGMGVCIVAQAAIVLKQ